MTVASHTNKLLFYRNRERLLKKEFLLVLFYLWVKNWLSSRQNCSPWRHLLVLIIAGFTMNPALILFTKWEISNFFLLQFKVVLQRNND